MVGTACKTCTGVYRSAATHREAYLTKNSHFVADLQCISHATLISPPRTLPPSSSRACSCCAGLSAGAVGTAGPASSGVLILIYSPSDYSPSTPSMGTTPSSSSSSPSSPTAAFPSCCACCICWACRQSLHRAFTPSLAAPVDPIAAGTPASSSGGRAASRCWLSPTATPSWPHCGEPWWLPGWEGPANRPNSSSLGVPAGQQPRQRSSNGECGESGGFRIRGELTTCAEASASFGPLPVLCMHAGCNK